jgi:uncharacterized protein with gpF-like domain
MPSKYDKTVKAMIAEAERKLDSQGAQAIRALNTARKKVIATVAQTEWDMFYLPQMKNAVDAAMAEFATVYGKNLTAAQGDYWDFGQAMVDRPLAVVGVTAALPAIDTAVLRAMQTYSTHLIDNLGRDAAAKVYNEIAMGLMGQKSPYEVMKAIGTNLSDKSHMKSIAARAEMITKQECGRILEAASQDRLAQASKVVPNLKKEWQHGGSSMPRPSHQAAHGQVRPVNEPFLVDGEELMYPRDPAGSPGNTINCSCYTVPYLEDVA